MAKKTGELQEFAKFFANFHYFHNISYANGFNLPKFFLPNFLQFLFTKLFTAKVFYYTVLACRNYKICKCSNTNMNKPNAVFSVLVIMACHQTFSGQNKHLFSHIKGNFLEFTEYPDNFQSLSKALYFMQLI